MSRKVWSLVWLLVVSGTVSVLAVGCSGPDAPKKPKSGGPSNTKT